MKGRYTKLLVLWTFFVCILSLTPGGQLPRADFLARLPIDKVVHLCFYFVMCMLVYLSIVREYLWPRTRPNAKMVSGLVAMSIGIVLEFLQSYLIADRYFDIFDILANTLGILLAWLVVYFKQIK